jgi:serine/threonine protein kinase
MDYLPLGSLMSYTLQPNGVAPKFVCPLTETVIGEALAAKCFRGVIEGMKFLHSHRVAHRDLKLDNILVTMDGVCQLSDFGSSMCYKAFAPAVNDETGSKSKGGCEDGKPIQFVRDTAGTWLFWAPEICSGDAAHESYDVFAADVWAVGICLWTALFGSLPFWSPTEAPLDIFERIEKREELKMPRKLNPKLEEFLMVGLLSKDPSKRLSFAQMLTSSWLASFQDVNATIAAPSIKNSVSSVGGKTTSVMLLALAGDEMSDASCANSTHVAAQCKRPKQLFKPFIVANLIDWSLRARYVVFDRKQKLKQKMHSEMTRSVNILRKASASVASNASSNSSLTSPPRSPVSPKTPSRVPSLLSVRSFESFESLTSDIVDGPISVPVASYSMYESTDSNDDFVSGNSPRADSLSKSALKKNRSSSEGKFRWRSGDRTKAGRSTCAIM